MGAAKKKKKVKKINKYFPWKDLETVGAALKKGQIPYVDFFPLKGAKKNDYIIIDPNKKIDLEANKQDTWDNVFKMAKELYDEPIKAMDVLMRGSKMTEKDESTYILCMHIENDWKEKENKDLALNKLVDKNLESYCMFVGVPYSDINPSIREFQTVPDTKMNRKYQRQLIIDRIVEKHRRLVKQKPKEFKKWLRENEEYYLGPY
tara:strand:+ start:1018 stop:1632 length:615 start_codon:yes stop_codon:yes gene_type:complete